MQSPSKYLQQTVAVSDFCSNLELSITDELTPKQNFLTYLQNEIESTLFARPTDSILRRHYDALINVEVEKRLAAMPDS